MVRLKRILAVALSICVLLTAGIIAVNAATVDEAEQAVGASGITVHYFCESGTPTIYYWNSLPQNISTNYPGPTMTSEGNSLKW